MRGFFATLRMTILKGNDNPERNCASGASENPARCLVSGGDGYGGGCALGDVALFLPVADGGADGVLGQDRAVDLDRRESEFLDDVGVGDGEGFRDGFALDPLGGEGAGGDGR